MSDSTFEILKRRSYVAERGNLTPEVRAREVVSALPLHRRELVGRIAIAIENAVGAEREACATLLDAHAAEERARGLGATGYEGRCAAMGALRAAQRGAREIRARGRA